MRVTILLLAVFVVFFNMAFASPLPEFASGPKITPSKQLLDWLNTNDKMVSDRKRRIQLPVVIRFDRYDQISIRDAFVGLSPIPRSDSIFLSLDDTAMGIPLIERLKEPCPSKSNWCAVWLEGYWGTLVELNPPSQKKTSVTKWPFAVLKVQKPIQKKLEEDKEIRILIEDTHSFKACHKNRKKG